MIFVGAALLVLGLLEIGQHVVKAPADIAALAPAVVVLVLAAHIEQAVDRARSAQHLAARLEHLAAVQARLRLGLVHPVDGFFLEQLAVAERHMDPDVAFLRAGLEQQHRMLAVRAQPIGQHAAGRARADDDVVEFGGFSRATLSMNSLAQRATSGIRSNIPAGLRANRRKAAPSFARSGPIEWEEVTGVPA